MPGYYDEITGDWVETGDTPGYDPLGGGSGTGTINYGSTVNSDGSVTYTDPDGSVYTVSPSGTYTTNFAGKSYTYDPAKNGFVDASGNVINTGSAPSGLMDKIVTAIQKNPFAAAGAAAAGLKALTGGNTTQTGGYQGSIPKLQAVRQQVQYNDPNRRPGEAGRQYFTDTQYAAPGAVDAAKTAAAEQASGLQAAYTAAKPQTNPYAGTFAMPWQKKQGASPAAAGIAELAKERFMPSGARLTEINAPQAKKDLTAQDYGAPQVATTPQGGGGFEGTPEQLAKLGNLEGSAYESKNARELGIYTPDFYTTQNKSKTENPLKIPFARGDDSASMEYTPEQGRRDAFLQSLNPDVSRQQREVSMGQAAQQAAQNVQTAAHGGIMHAAKGRYLQGNTDGMADKINTSIDGKEPAKLSHGEFVIPADVVSHLGNGNSDAGADKLYQMMSRIRKARTGNPEQGKRINPDKFMPGGQVKGYDAGGTVSSGTTGTGSGSTAANPLGTSTSSTLSPWAGDYVTGMLGKGQALAEQPYQAYTGPLTAGASNLQQQQFAGLSDLAKTGLTPTQYTGGVFDAASAQQYMNPYLKAALDPQLQEMRRQSQINLQPTLAKLTQAGGYGGGRQAIMESEAARNLLAEQNKTIGQGYATAYDKAMGQFNEDARRRLQTEQAQQAANESSANFGLKTLQELGQAGAAERGITSEGVAADKAQFEEQRDYPYKMLQYQKDLLTGLPITTQATTPNTTEIGQINQQLSGILGLYQTLAKLLPQSQTAP